MINFLSLEGKGVLRRQHTTTTAGVPGQLDLNEAPMATKPPRPLVRQEASGRGGREEKGLALLQI